MMKLPISPRLGAALAFLATLALGLVMGSRDDLAQSWSKSVLLLIASCLTAVFAHSLLRQPVQLRRDIKARTADLQASNEALAYNTSLLRAAAISGRVFPWEWDVSSDKLYWGISPEQILGPEYGAPPKYPDFRDMVHPDDLARYIETGQRTLRNGVPYYCEFRLVGSDGAVRWIAACGEPERDARNRVVRMIGASIDITERKRAEEGLQLFSRATEQLNQSVVVTDSLGNIEYVNPHFSVCTGYRRDEVIGRNPRLLSSGETPPEVFHDMWACLLRGETWRGELVNRRKDGSLFWESSVISPVRNRAGETTHFVAVKEDITARKKADEKIRKLAQDLAEANGELEAFSYTVSHDLRAPLRAVDGFIGLALESAASKLSGEEREYLNRAKAGASRMGRLIEDMLELARLSRHEISRQPVSLSRIAREIIEELRQFEPERRIDVVIGEGIEDLADPVLMRNVLQNLLGNAWKFTRKTPDARIEFGRLGPDGAARYFVRDNGAGFDMKYAGKLFLPFQRLHGQHEFEGTGMGLASVSRILHRHGGGITASSTPGAGATFEFSLR
jgi:PAS domain S-box-containing protein